MAILWLSKALAGSFLTFQGVWHRGVWILITAMIWNFFCPPSPRAGTLCVFQVPNLCFISQIMTNLDQTSVWPTEGELPSPNINYILSTETDIHTNNTPNIPQTTRTAKKTWVISFFLPWGHYKCSPPPTQVGHLQSHLYFSPVSKWQSHIAWLNSTWD